MTPLGNVFVLAVTLGTQVSAQEVDLAGAYYHFTLAKMHEHGQEYSEAIERFERAIELDSQSADLRVEFAYTLIRTRKIDRAREQCLQAIELDPQNPESRFLLAQIYVRSSQPWEKPPVEKAIGELESAVKLAPEYFQALYYLGQLYLKQQGYDKAVATFTRYIVLQPADPSGYHFKAVAQTNLGQIDQALDTLEESLDYRVDVRNLELLDGLYKGSEQWGRALQTYQRAFEHNPELEIGRRVAFLLTGEGRYSEALSLLRDLMGNHPQDLRIQVQLAQALAAAKQMTDSMDVLNKVLEQDADNMEAKYQLARNLGEMGQRTQAIQRVLQLLEMDLSPDNRKRFRIELGFLYQQVRKYDKATAIFRQLNAEFPQNPEDRLRLINVLLDSGKMDEALSLSEKLLLDRPDDENAILARAQVLSAAGRLESAIRLLEASIEGHVAPDPFYRLASQLYVDHKQYKSAQEIIQQRIQMEPPNENLRFQLGAVYERQEKLAEAEAQFQAILKDNSTHAGALNYLGYMLAERGIRLQEALVHIKKAVELDPYNGAYLDSLGWVYFKLGHLELAERYLRQAVQVKNSDAVIHEHLGDVYYKLGQYEEARGQYEQSISFAKETEERKKVRRKLFDLNKLLSKRDR